VTRVQGLNVSCRRVSRDSREDFYRLHGDMGNSGSCWCVAWWTDSWEGWGSRSSEEDRSLRDELFARGQFDGYLLYVDRVVVGWCQADPRDRLPKLLETYRLEPEPEVWAVTCFLISPDWQARGLAHRLLQDALLDLRACNVRTVEGYPRRGELMPNDEVWQGSEAMFVQAGFTLTRDHERPPDYRKTL
jgi:GNAT superfamily N-acetyltransferase